MGVVEKRVSTVPLCLTCGEHDHYAIICPNERLYFCIEKSELESEADLKEAESHSKE